MTTINYLIPLPPVDEHGTPTEKMPNCPHCGEDELGLTDPPDRAICCRCGTLVGRAKSAESITAQLTGCTHCSWRGRLEACDPADDADDGFECPQCQQFIQVRCA